MNTCPYCKKNMLDSEPLKEMRKILTDNGVYSENVNPGGRSFGMPPPIYRIQISDNCNYCDLQEVKDAIRSDERRHASNKI